MRRMLIVGLGALALAVPVGLGAGTATAAGPRALPKQPVAVGTGGGAATMSPYATAAAIRVLEKGGNAVDGAVAAAAALGVTEPFVAGPGGGGFFVYHRARDGKVFTIDGREKAPAGAAPDMFLENGKPMDFETAVESGKSVGVPGNVATWGEALRRFGSRPLSEVLRPAEQVARRGFPLDEALVSAIEKNQKKLAHFPAAAALFLPGGQVPEAGDILRNPDLARTYKQLGREGWRSFYTGPIAQELARTVQHPETAPGTPAVAGGSMTAADMRSYTAPDRAPASWTYRGYRLFGMAPPSSGGSTVGETMNMLENFDQRGDDRTTALYRYLEALKLAYADRGKYLGDPDFVKVPLRGLLSKDYAKQRASLIGPTAAATPVDPGMPWPYNGSSGPSPARAGTSADQHTNHLVVSDRWGNVVSYTNTIEQIAGSGIVLPNRGFLLNNELTDFNFETDTANSVAPNKRPRSSMSPTIVTRNGRVVEAIGSPGGYTIITTVLQSLLNQIDFGMTLPQAIEAPRANQANGSTTLAEQGFIDQYGAALEARGEAFKPTDYIGIVAALAFLPGGKVQAATESWRGGGGSAMVVRPDRDRGHGRH